MAYNHLDLHPEAVAFIQGWNGREGGPKTDSNPEKPKLSLQERRAKGSSHFIDVSYNFTGTRFELFIPTPNSSCKSTLIRFNVLSLKVIKLIDCVVQCNCVLSCV
jgi:hypothetical protein